MQQAALTENALLAYLVGSGEECERYGEVERLQARERIVAMALELPELSPRELGVLGPQPIDYFVHGHALHSRNLRGQTDVPSNSRATLEEKMRHAAAE